MQGLKFFLLIKNIQESVNDSSAQLQGVELKLPHLDIKKWKISSKIVALFVVTLYSVVSTKVKTYSRR